MTPELDREALTTLAAIRQLSPDIRLGQLMAHLGFLGEIELSKGLGSIDDDELLSVMYRHREELQNRLQGAPAVLPASSIVATSLPAS